MNGAGNDFIVIDNRDYGYSDTYLQQITPLLCPRRTGIGADGLLALNGTKETNVDYRMRYVNADGSIATMCGNGARCLAWFARSAGIGGDEMVFESDAGRYRASVQEASRRIVTLYVPPPRHYREKVAIEDEVPNAVSYIWTGTEHVVCFVEDVRQSRVEDEGRRLREHPQFAPQGTNVNFVQIVTQEPARVRVRTFEKGVEAETLACGTGALAAALVSTLQGRVTGNEVGVQMPGGELRVGFRQSANELSDVYLSGPVAEVFQGTVDLEKLRQAA